MRGHKRDQTKAIAKARASRLDLHYAPYNVSVTSGVKYIDPVSLALFFRRASKDAQLTRQLFINYS